MKRILKGLLVIAIITALYMALEYKTRGYFAIGAEILFVPFAVSMLVLTKEEK